MPTVGVASSSPGMVEAELASDSEIVNRVPHRGHFNRLPAFAPAGRFKMMRQKLH